MPKKLILACKMALAVLSTLGISAIFHPVAAKTLVEATLAEIQLADRIEKARDRLVRQLTIEEVTTEKAKQISQWYNWPNWYNGWFNRFRNW